MLHAANQTRLGKKNIERLRRALRLAYKDATPFRRFRRLAIEQYAGSHYGNQSTRAVPANMIELMVNVLTRSLVASVPRVMVTTEVTKLKKPSAVMIELGMNRLLKDIDFGDTHRAFVKDAMFSLAIIKVDDEKVGEWTEPETGEVYELKMPTADTVSFDRWVHDSAATKWRDLQFMGHRFQMDEQEARSMYRGKIKEGDVKEETVDRGTEDGEVADMAKESMTAREDYRKKVEAWDIFLPRERMIATFKSGEGVDDMFGEYLGTRDYEGPKRGPYIPLRLSDVPDNIMPLTPVATQYDWHEFINSGYRKLLRQALAEKTVGGYQKGSGKDDAERIMGAGDLQMIGMDNPESVKEYRFGGASQSLLAIIMHGYDRFMSMSGNLDALGGIQAQSGTATQDTLLEKNATKRLEDMQEQVINATKQVVESLAWHIVRNPLFEIPVTYEIMGRKTDLTFTEENIQGEYLDYNFNIDPYSLQHRSPGEVFNQLVGLLQGLLMPAAEQMAAQGVTLDWTQIIEQLSKLSNTTELKDILSFVNLPEGQAEFGSSPQRQAPVTKRINERVNRTADTRQAGESNVTQLMSAGSQQGGGIG